MTAACTATWLTDVTRGDQEHRNHSNDKIILFPKMLAIHELESW